MCGVSKYGHHQTFRQSTAAFLSKDVSIRNQTKFLILKGKNRLKLVKNCNKWRINITVPTQYQLFAVTFGNDYEEINSHYRNILHSGIPDIMVAQLYTEILQDATNIIATVVVFRMDLKIFSSI